MNDLAVSEYNSKGRVSVEGKHKYRGAFERDRDRIIHCSAFRRLEGKTQVFMPGENDHYRTRLTHSIEVSQIGRTIAKALGVNVDLTEAICLGHDLGHSPFGHLGEKALNKLMAGFGGFEHNAQTLRIVELMERPYAEFAGLNLMYETRLGFCKHKSRYDLPGQSEQYSELNCSVEGQIADVADRVAYNCHDLEDGLRSLFLSDEQVKEIAICAEVIKDFRLERIDDVFVRRNRLAKKIMDRLVSDVIETSLRAIDDGNILQLSDVYCRNDNIVSVSGDVEKKLCELEDFLMSELYNSDKLRELNKDVNGWLGKLFEKFCSKPELMPKYYQSFIDQFGLERTVCDYVSGMTDRFAIAQLER
jgi:dGTPase